MDIPGFENLEAGGYVFEISDIDNIEVVSLLFQTGYLTIKSVKTPAALESGNRYVLNYPNLEVRQSFLRRLLKAFTGEDMVTGGKILDTLVDSLQGGDFNRFFEAVQSVFAAIPYNIFPGDRESFYHTVIYLMVSLIGLTVSAEVQINNGRINVMIETGFPSPRIPKLNLGTPKNAGTD